MTERGLYEAILYELRKSKAPHLHLEEFLYFSSKGIQEYLNTEAERFETEQKTSDAFQSLTDEGTFLLNPTTGMFTSSSNTVAAGAAAAYRSGNRYNSDFIQLPMFATYFKLLSCVPKISTKFNYKCYAAGYTFSGAAKKLTADSGSGKMNNAWLKPKYNNPFYQIKDHLNASGSNPGNNVITSPDILVYYGDSSRFYLKEVYVEFLKKPKALSLTQVQIDTPTDTSAALDFMEHVCNEIVKRITLLILENSRDGRTQTFGPVNKSVS
jgi:hypothetical protein